MFIKITQFTIVDQMRLKSFYLLLVVCIGLLFAMRGCFSTDFVVNGQHIESMGHVSRIIFQIIVMGMLLMVSMISMKIFSRDQNDGSVHMFLSRPVQRWQYLIGRIAGTWLLSSWFMFMLHLTMVLIIWLHTSELPLKFLGASIVCSVNLLFIIVAVCFFSLLMPDFISAMLAIGLLFTGFISDGGYKVLSSEILTTLAPSVADQSITSWRIFYPKLFMVQAYADSIINQSKFVGMGPIHPLINISIYIILLILLTLFVFNKKEI
jgi:ABC-type transport system involved in multi-copper enzyme maturation permease subunit